MVTFHKPNNETNSLPVKSKNNFLVGPVSIPSERSMHLFSSIKNHKLDNFLEFSSIVSLFLASDIDRGDLISCQSKVTSFLLLSCVTRNLLIKFYQRRH